MSLQNKHCVPCESGGAPFTPKQTEDYLAQVNGWMLHPGDTRGVGAAIEKQFTFKDFKRALVFVNKVGDVAEAEGHHPDIHLHGYNKVRITLSTHATDGLSENDFILASKIDEL